MELLLPLSILAALAAALWAALLHRRLRRLLMLSPVAADRSSRGEELFGPNPPLDGSPSYRTDEARSTGDSEAALRESETRFRHVVESLGEGLLINDWDGNVLYANRRITELTGWTPAELVGRSAIEMLVPDELRDSVYRMLEERRDGKSGEYEIPMLRKDGTRFWTEVHGRPHRNANGEIVGSLSTVTDITERRAVQEALRESEERYRALFEEDVAGNFITSVAGEIVACNQAFAQIFGFSSVEEAVGSPTVPLTVNEATREEFLNLVRQERRLEFHEMELRRRDGSPVHVVENVNGIFDDEGELVAMQGHLIDVTDRKMLEEQLHQSQKMEAVGRLAGGIAHDFNNLLTAIGGYTDLLLIDPGTTPQIRDDLGKIQQAADRAATLTNQLLAFSRRQVLQPKVVDLNAVIEGLSEMLGRLIGEDITFETRLEPGIWRVKADPNQLEQVLMNLVVNARDAMPAGGDLVVTTGNVALGEAWAARTLEVEPGEYAMMEVSDTGDGIPPELQDQIFEPFFTTKEAGKGTGLGLSMAYGLMKQSGGHIAVESAPGEGSAFRIYLPRVTEEEMLPSAEDDSSPSPDGAETILLVEAEPMIRSLARRVLSRKGYTILESADPIEAMAKSREWRGPIHLLLTELVMAGMSGETLAKELLELRPQTKVLFICGAEESPTGSEPLLRPLLPTPFTPGELAQAVRDVLDERPVRPLAPRPV